MKMEIILEFKNTEKNNLKILNYMDAKKQIILNNKFLK
jgi:hypothetical protein